MTQYTARISFTCPVSMLDEANAFMAWVGEGLGDAETFRTPESGSYALASGAYKPDFISRLSTPVTEDNRPEWGAGLSLELAQAGQAALQFEIDEADPDSAALTGKGKTGKIVAPIKGVAGNPDDAATWQAGVTLSVGDLVTHSGTTYMCIQAHTTQVDWTPNVVPALFLERFGHGFGAVGDHLIPAHVHSVNLNPSPVRMHFKLLGSALKVRQLAFVVQPRLFCRGP